MRHTLRNHDHSVLEELPDFFLFPLLLALSGFASQCMWLAFIFAGMLAPPPTASSAMVNGGMRPKEVIQAYEASATKVGAVLMTVVAVAVGVGIKGVGYVLQKLPVM